MDSKMCIVPCPKQIAFFLEIQLDIIQTDIKYNIYFVPSLIYGEVGRYTGDLPTGTYSLSS
jgi:hypothetical protein